MVYCKDFILLTFIFSITIFGLAVKINTIAKSRATPNKIPSSTPINTHAKNVPSNGIISNSKTNLDSIRKR